jgi:hypothetical protein
MGEAFLIFRINTARTLGSTYHNHCAIRQKDVSGKSRP